MAKQLTNNFVKPRSCIQQQFSRDMAELMGGEANACVLEQSIGDLPPKGGGIFGSTFAARKQVGIGLVILEFLFRQTKLSLLLITITLQ